MSKSHDTTDLLVLDDRTRRMAEGVEWTRNVVVAPTHSHVLGDNEVIEAATARYVRDEQQKASARRYREAQKYKRRRDVLWIGKVLGMTLNAYDMVTSFMLAHAMGVVTRGARDRRADHCIGCTYRRRRLAPNLKDVPIEPGTPLSWRDICGGHEPGQSCSCPDDPIWRPAKLRWLLWLNWFGCPIGHWDRGAFVPLTIGQESFEEEDGVSDSAETEHLNHLARMGTIALAIVLALLATSVWRVVLN